DHRADVECGLHGIELVRGPRYARTTWHGRAGHHRTHEFRARGVLQRLESARERIHEAVAGRLIRLGAADLERLRVLGDRYEDGIGCGALRGLDLVSGHAGRFLSGYGGRRACRAPRPEPFRAVDRGAGTAGWAGRCSWPPGG